MQPITRIKKTSPQIEHSIDLKYSIDLGHTEFYLKNIITTIGNIIYKGIYIDIKCG